MIENDIKEICVSQEKLAETVKALGAQISRDYAGKELTLVCILKGAVVFAADLMREITVPCRIEFMRISSYGNSTNSGEIKIVHDIEINPEGKNLLIVEDILDSGKTLYYVRDMLRKRNPASIKICALLDKPERRTADIKADYAGLNIPDEFVVGYGLDYADRYRNLPYIGILNKSVYSMCNE